MFPRIALIGCGNWGKNILRDAVALNCDVIVVTHLREQALSLGATDVFESIDQLKDQQCDGFIIAVPVRNLPEVAEAALSYGKPVFCEKPVYRYEHEKQCLLAAGAAERLFSMYKFCYHSGICLLKDIICSQELGPIEQIRLRRTGWEESFQGSDCFWFVVVHQVSIAFHLLGALPEPISSIAGLHNQIAHEACFVLGKTPQVLIDVSCRSPIKSISAELHFQDGVALLADSYATEIMIKKSDSCELRHFTNEMPLRLELQEFLDYLRGGPAPRCNFAMTQAINDTIAKVRRLAGITD